MNILFGILYWTNGISGLVSIISIIVSIFLWRHSTLIPYKERVRKTKGLFNGLYKCLNYFTQVSRDLQKNPKDPRIRCHFNLQKDQLVNTWIKVKEALDDISSIVTKNSKINKEIENLKKLGKGIPYFEEVIFMIKDVVHYNGTPENISTLIDLLESAQRGYEEVESFIYKEVK